MKIYVISKLEFDAYCEKFNLNDNNIELNKNLYCISIHGLSEKEIPYFKFNHTNVLNLRFDDVESDSAHGKAMTIEQGMEIISFLKNMEINNNTMLLVHCYAGISRSGAVGTFCNEYFNQDKTEFINRNKHILPNGAILRILHNLTIYSDYTK